MQGAQDGEEQEEEDIDEGEIPNDEAGEEEDEVSDAFSEPEDVEGMLLRHRWLLLLNFQLKPNLVKNRRRCRKGGGATSTMIHFYARHNVSPHPLLVVRHRVSKSINAAICVRCAAAG